MLSVCCWTKVETVLWEGKDTVREDGTEGVSVGSYLRDHDHRVSGFGLWPEKGQIGGLTEQARRG